MVLQLAAFSFDTGATTHVGRVRTLNEDRYVVRPDLGVWAVADGMGGHDRGEVASSLIVRLIDSIGPAVSAPDLLARFEDRIIRANAELRRLAESTGADIIGATLAALLTSETYYAVVWSGDSRVYRLRAGSFEQLTRDHTEAQELVDQGVISPEEARTWPRRNVITRAIGVVDEPELAFEHGLIAPGDLFLICSDGLTGHLDDHEIAATLGTAEPTAAGVQGACDKLVATTLDRGATDNVTVIVVACRPADGPPGRHRE